MNKNKNLPFSDYIAPDFKPMTTMTTRGSQLNQPRSPIFISQLAEIPILQVRKSGIP